LFKFPIISPNFENPSGNPAHTSTKLQKFFQFSFLNIFTCLLFAEFFSSIEMALIDNQKTPKTPVLAERYASYLQESPVCTRKEMVNVDCVDIN
jgi:hypothetical protein